MQNITMTDDMHKGGLPQKSIEARAVVGAHLVSDGALDKVCSGER